MKKIENVIETSLKECQNLNFDGYYLKRHIINHMETKINYDSREQDIYIANFLQNTTQIMEYIKKKEEILFTEKINNLLINTFEISLDDYYSQYYKYEILQKDLFIDEYYYYSMLEYSKKLIKSKCNYLNLLIHKNKNNNHFGNSTYEKIDNLDNEIMNIILKQINKGNIHNKSDISYLKNKKSIIETYSNSLFNNEFIEEYPLSKTFRKTFVYNNSMLNQFYNYMEKGIRSQSNLELQTYLDYKIKDLKIPLSGLNWRKNISIIIKNISDSIKYTPIPLEGSKLFGKKINYNFTTLYNYIKYLESQCNNLEIKEQLIIDNETLDNLMKDIEYLYKINGIDKVIIEYNNFTKSLNPINQNIINDEANIIRNNKTNNNLDKENYRQVSEILKNYSTAYLNEIKTYIEKLKVFAMIDGLNYIKIENIDELKDIWNFSLSTNLRNLADSKKEKKFLNIEKFYEFHKRVDKTNKKNIFLKMNDVIKNVSYFRNIGEEYNTRNIFNSTCDPISLLNISNMVEILNDDTNNFVDMIINKKIRTKYESIKVNLNLFDSVLHANEFLFKEKYLIYIYLNLQII